MPSEHGPHHSDGSSSAPFERIDVEDDGSQDSKFEKQKRDRERYSRRTGAL